MNTILDILQHALGRDQYGRGSDYRNHYCTGEGSRDFALCREAVAQGLMREHPPTQLSGGDHVFVVTDAGKAYIAEHSPHAPKLTRCQVKYRRWLAVADVCNVSFGDWLRSERAASAGGGQ